MAKHQFICETCGYSIITEDTKASHVCPTCNIRMFWNLSGGNFFGDGTYSKKIVSESLAINANQVDEHRRLFPDVELTFKDGCACPTFSDFRTHENYLKATGFVKQPQRKHNTRKYFT